LQFFSWMLFLTYNSCCCFIAKPAVLELQPLSKTGHMREYCGYQNLTVIPTLSIYKQLLLVAVEGCIGSIHVPGMKRLRSLNNATAGQVNHFHNLSSNSHRPPPLSTPYLPAPSARVCSRLLGMTILIGTIEADKGEC
jgi:hypothetical protein